MILKLLGIADIFAIIALIASSILPQSILIFLGLYLIIKGLIFMLIGGPFPSFFDMSCGFYLISVSYGIEHWIPTTIVLLFLAQKAFISLV